MALHANLKEIGKAKVQVDRSLSYKEPGTNARVCYSKASTRSVSNSDGLDGQRHLLQWTTLKEAGGSVNLIV